jgi:hypothetical protein
MPEAFVLLETRLDVLQPKARRSVTVAVIDEDLRAA